MITVHVPSNTDKETMRAIASAVYEESEQEVLVINSNGRSLKYDGETFKSLDATVDGLILLAPRLPNITYAQMEEEARAIMQEVYDLLEQKVFIVMSDDLTYCYDGRIFFYTRPLDLKRQLTHKFTFINEVFDIKIPAGKIIDRYLNRVLALAQKYGGSFVVELRGNQILIAHHLDQLPDLGLTVRKK